LSVDLLTTTDHDFPQFLGPNRDLSVAGIQLERDWRTHPPRLLWRQPIGAGWSAFSVVNAYALTMEQRGDDEMVSCYEVNSGKLRWWHSIPARHSTVLGGIGPRGTPTIHEGRVYALGATGVLRCLDGATGKPVWPSIDLPQMYGVPPGRDTDAVAWGRAASPLIVDDLVVVPAGGPLSGPHVSLVAFDMHTGDKVWEGGTRQISYASPSLATIDGQRQILIVNEDTVSGHDPSTGQLLWQFDWPGSSNTNATVSQAVAMPGDRVLLSKAYGGGAAMLHVFRNDQRWSVDELWRDRGLLKTKFCNVAVKDNYVFGLSDGILECVDASTGRRQWKKGRYGHGQVLLVDDVLLVQAESGEVLMVEADPIQHTELGRFQAIEGKTWNNLCLSGRCLLVRNALEAACYKMALVENRTLQKRSD
jgi:outer membrane protein assembly factor BamB